MVHGIKSCTLQHSFWLADSIVSFAVSSSQQGAAVSNVTSSVMLIPMTASWTTVNGSRCLTLAYSLDVCTGKRATEALAKREGRGKHNPGIAKTETTASQCIPLPLPAVLGGFWVQRLCHGSGIDFPFLLISSPGT